MKSPTRFFAIVLWTCTVIVAMQPVTAQQIEEQLQPPAQDSFGPKPDLSGLVTLRFVTEPEYPPFNYYDDDGQLSGFNVDIARAICRELELSCEITAAAWDGIVPALQSKEADAAIASIAITPKSLANLDFSDRYYETPARFARRKGTQASGVTPEDMDGRSIGVLAGTAHEAYLRDFFPDAEATPFKTAEEARAALVAGEVEFLFGDVVSLMFWTNGQESQGCCELLPGGFNEARYFGEGVGIAVAKGNLKLIEILNYGLARVRSSGRYEEVFLRYFPANFY